MPPFDVGFTDHAADKAVKIVAAGQKDFIKFLLWFAAFVGFYREENTLPKQALGALYLSPA